ncbi:hypothetical protein PPSIR1_24799 [Plesiocystis pacifica SIR-1]|uniref:Uncharacterized protein n=1 Tax=Plesiocystis pacifica SIR-1 TaxID=391625 RepID=A6G9F4_9BACT|nr:hypothetical protein [Plesiocystis pacifica]EDM77462.1 hypothetical protein PPSIR1_24799 [Plesiocystis pacifica SIR-1]
MTSDKRASLERYDADQVGLILERAAELQAAKGSAISRRMSIDEVEAIASEAGIDAALVRQAAGELARPKPEAQTHNAFIGGPSALRFERRLEGEVSEACFDEIAHEIHLTLDEPGTVTRSSRSLAWRTNVASNTPGRRISVSVSTGRGETSIRVDEQLQTLIGSMFGGILGGVGGGGMGLIVLPAMWNPALIPVFMVGWMGASYALARGLFRRQSRRRAEALQAVFERIVTLCEDDLYAKRRLLPASESGPESDS